MIKKTGRLFAAESHFIVIVLFALVALVLGSLLSSCSINSINAATTETPQIGDGGFLSGQSCGPPCFFGVIPGVTTKNNAITLLQSKGLYQDCTETDNTKENGRHEIACTYPTWILVVSIGNNGDLVSGIGFSPSVDITVAQVIAKYGQPTVVSVAAIGPSDRDFVAYMDLYYDQINTDVGLIEQQNSATYEINPTTLVGTIDYYDQEEYQMRRQYFQSWMGYGIYKESYP